MLKAKVGDRVALRLRKARDGQLGTVEEIDSYRSQVSRRPFQRRIVRYHVRVDVDGALLLLGSSHFTVVEVAKRTTVWKIVSARKGSYAGEHPNKEYLSSGYIWGAASCKYARGLKTTGVRGTPVLAFRTLKDARAHWHEHAHVQIWRALAELPVSVSKIGTFDLTLSLDRIEVFWSGRDEMWIPAPAGTVACRSIELVREEKPRVRPKMMPNA